MKIQKLLSLVFAILLSWNVNSQQTGMFTKTITFSGGNRTVYYYVPASYNAANKYKMIIGLHGLGGDPSSMCQVLQMNAVSSSSSPVYNAIVVCPDGGSDDDFLTPSSDTNLLTASMSWAMSNYNIDPDYIYMNGISLGGRAALRYGLINWWRFRGIELWCPAIQTMTEANSSTFYPYANSKYIPIVFTTGSEDGYVQNGKIPVVLGKIFAAGSIMASSRIVYGMGHQQPPSSYVYSAYNFINSHASSYVMNDARISDIPSPFDEVCATSITPTVTIQNKGKNTLTSATINYQLDGGPVQTYNWTGSLNRLATANITLPVQTVTPGNHTLTASTSMPNGVADGLSSNDSFTKNFVSVTNGSVTLTETFQSSTFPPAGWSHAWPNGDRVWFWEKITGVGAAGSSSCVRFDTYTDWNRVGRKYQFRTALYDFSGATTPVLTYDYAYALDTQDPTQKKPDTLVVYYSDNCGSTWNQLLVKGNNALTTAPGAPKHFQPSSPSHWKTETINLAALTGKTKVMFAFEMHHAWGNLFYLDNVTLTGVTGVSEEHLEEGFVVYPNPSSGIFSVRAPSEGGVIEITDIMGRIVYSENFTSGSFDVDLTRETNGLYFVKLMTTTFTASEKVIISR